MDMDAFEASLTDEARRRYLTYALSVVASRALPDVRDGLKPVQRRILYTMRKDLGLVSDAKAKKSAKIVGDVMGSYHPHGDSSIYEAMVRMAQPWVMRHPLVDGQGNFGSPDGDSAAAYRYTEARLLPIAMELLSEIDKRTVAWRPNYDGTRSEPVVLPARFPHLLVNGSQGIAVGMATSIPPHNLNEIIDACVAQIEAPEILTTKQLLKYVKGPDFPTGGLLHASKDELLEIYETGSGSLKLRGDYKLEDKKGGVDIILTQVPYAIERKSLVEKIADVVISKKLPGLLDVRDESTTEVRVVLELKKGTDPGLVMAYLYKHTPLASSVSVNLTCLVPGTDEHGVAREELPPAPARLGLGAIIRHFLDFRMETVVKRIQFDLAEVHARVHILEGFETVFDALDETIRIIRKSQNKRDAAEKLIARFKLSEEQVDAILELRLYRLAQLEINLIQKELAEKRAEMKRLTTLLNSDSKRWELIKTELSGIKEQYGDRRRTKVVGSSDEPEYAAEDFIVDEPANVILTQQGWIKRVREVKDLSTTRVREGDAVLSVVAGSTKQPVAFFSNHGVVYVTRIHDVPSTTGYGDPIQKFFKLADGERIIAALSLDPRAVNVPPPAEDGTPQKPFMLAVTRAGLGFRFSLSAHREPSTKAGRKYARLNEGDEIVLVALVDDDDSVMVATSDAHALGVKVADITVVSNAAKGAMVIKVNDGERVIGGIIGLAARDAITIETEKGKSLDLSLQSLLGERADKGHAILKRDRFARVVLPPPALPSLEPN
jgi:DNA gyrase subunit A